MSQYVNEVLSEMRFQKRLAKLAEQKKAGLEITTFCQKNPANVAERPMMGGAQHG